MIYFHRFFHYKPSSYWSIPIYGNPHIIISLFSSHCWSALEELLTRQTVLFWCGSRASRGPFFIAGIGIFPWVSEKNQWDPQSRHHCFNTKSTGHPDDLWWFGVAYCQAKRCVSCALQIFGVKHGETSFLFHWEAHFWEREPKVSWGSSAVPTTT